MVPYRSSPRTIQKEYLFPGFDGDFSGMDFEYDIYLEKTGYDNSEPAVVLQPQAPPTTRRRPVVNVDKTNNVSASEPKPKRRPNNQGPGRDRDQDRLGTASKKDKHVAQPQKPSKKVIASKPAVRFRPDTSSSSSDDSSSDSEPERARKPGKKDTPSSRKPAARRQPDSSSDSSDESSSDSDSTDVEYASKAEFEDLKAKVKKLYTLQKNFQGAFEKKITLLSDDLVSFEVRHDKSFERKDFFLMRAIIDIRKRINIHTQGIKDLEEAMENMVDRMHEKVGATGQTQSVVGGASHGKAPASQLTLNESTTGALKKPAFRQSGSSRSGTSLETGLTNKHLDIGTNKRTHGFSISLVRPHEIADEVLENLIHGGSPRDREFRHISLSSTSSRVSTEANPPTPRPHPLRTATATARDYASHDDAEVRAGPSDPDRLQRLRQAHAQQTNYRRAEVEDSDDEFRTAKEFASGSGVGASSKQGVGHQSSSGKVKGKGKKKVIDV